MVEEENSNSSFANTDDLNDSGPKSEDTPCESDDDEVDYKSRYRALKRKLKCLLYEQECFHDELRKYQKKCLRVSRDKSFLLDRLLQYEQPELSSDDQNTSSSEEEVEQVKKLKIAKSKGKTPKSQNTKNSMNVSSSVTKARCRRVENGKQCLKMVSTKIKSGTCLAHRQSTTKPPSKPPGSKKMKSEKPAVKSGGKDIGQIREAMEAMENSSPGMYGEEEDELVIDLPH